MRLSQIAEAGRSIEDGEWVNEVDGLPGVKLKTLGFNSNPARKYLQSFLRKKGWHKKKSLAPKEWDILYANLVTDVTAQDWAGIEDDAGAPIPFSREELEKTLFVDGDRMQINSEMRPLLDGWRDAGTSVGKLEEELEAQDEKNSGSSSSGDQSGGRKRIGSKNASLTIAAE